MEETPSHYYLRQEKEQPPRSLGIFQILSNSYHDTSYYRSGSDRIHDRGSSYCNSHHQCDECEGDCDEDSDCKSGLYCYQRKKKESVPGCSGGSSSDSESDFCVKKKYSYSTDTETKTKTESSDGTDRATDKGKDYCTSSHPCGECYGDCDEDSDCKHGLICYHREKEGESVPGCSGHPNSKSDFCVKEKYEKHSEPTETETKTKDSDESTDEAKDKGKDYCTSSDPCGECYGDCDKDSHCKHGLICYQRDKEGESVPGCSGHPNSKSDFCVKEKYGKHSESKDTKTPTKSDAKSRSKISDKGSDYCSREYPCDECEGDCDKDSDCKSGLYCYKRDPGESVPGCSGGSSAHSRTDFCVKDKHYLRE